MICFEVYRNGEKLCRAGLQDLSVINCIVDQLRLPASDEPTLSLHVAGSSIGDKTGNSYHEWIEHLDLFEGDEITIRIVASDDADPPSSTRFNSEEWVLRQKHEYYLQLKEEFEPKV